MLRLGDLWTSLTGVAELTSRVEPRRRTSAWLLLDFFEMFLTENLRGYLWFFLIVRKFTKSVQNISIDNLFC